MPKKITSLLTAAVMLLSLFIFSPGMALGADGTTWDGDAYEITAGSGTEAEPYIIDTAGKLAFLAQHVTEADYQSKHYSLTEDLNLSEHNWVPIGNQATASSGFQGYFDGNGHIISGMSAAHDQSGGLFGVISSATLKNLRVSGDASAETTSKDWVRSGGIAGLAVDSIIKNCYHLGNVISDTKLSVNGVTTASGTPSAVGLSVGVNTIPILVTAQDETTTKTYTLTITRAAGSSSNGGGGGSSNYYTASVDANNDNGEVTFDKTSSTAGSRVTITVTPDEGYQIDHLLILDKDGGEVTYTNNGDGTYSFTMPSGDITVKAQFIEIPVVLPENPPAFPFIDVGENDWYYQAIDYVYRNQLFAGTGEEHFEPKTPMSRAMLVTVLWRLEGQANIDINRVFSDVPAGEYYAIAVDWANRQEIVKGYGDSRFGPLDNITREQMAVILYKFAEFKGYDTSAAADLGIFHDSSSVSSWARDAVKWAVASQILTGKGNGILDPSGNASRAEAASILMRLVTNQEG